MEKNKNYPNSNPSTNPSNPNRKKNDNDTNNPY